MNRTCLSKRSGPNRHLHSFPTRRSSDLLAFDLSLRTTAAERRQRQRVSVPLGGQLLDEGDRKSTRLNSSHSQISYAVFCLKKKNVPRREDVVDLSARVAGRLEPELTLRV